MPEQTGTDWLRKQAQKMGVRKAASDFQDTLDQAGRDANMIQGMVYAFAYRHWDEMCDEIGIPQVKDLGGELHIWKLIFSLQHDLALSRAKEALHQTPPDKV